VFPDRHAVAPAMCAAWHGHVGRRDQEQDYRAVIRLWVCRDGLGGGGWGSILVLNVTRLEGQKLDVFSVPGSAPW
jgi:hypothetical protein